jgi:hypothetical protein
MLGRTDPPSIGEFTDSTLIATCLLSGQCQGLVDLARRHDAILAVLQAEREALSRLPDEGQIDAEVLRTLQRELDLEESCVHTESVVVH